MTAQSIHVEPSGANKLVGTVRRAGTFGPSYVVLSVANGVAQLEFLDSDEMATLPVEAVASDPLDE